MSLNAVAVLIVASFYLCGCSRFAPGNADLAGHHGRYSGVGIYSPTQQWARLAANQQSSDPQIARPADDQVIIVVQDSATGEVRACGDLTGYCVGMNPWKTALTPAQVAPLKLTEHLVPEPPGASGEPTGRSVNSEAPAAKIKGGDHSR